MSDKRRVNPMTWSDRWLSTWRALALAGLLAVLGLAWVMQSWPSPAQGPDPATILLMDDARFVYSPGWQIDAVGADPAEPADPWRQPAGVLTFSYTGQDLALALAEGDYWAYLLVTVDGQPANQLPVLPEAPGYRPLSAPERQTAEGPTVRWLTVHRAADLGPHAVRVEVWRGWGQTPLRGVAVDGLPAANLPAWPGVILLLAAGWMGAVMLSRTSILKAGRFGSPPPPACPIPKVFGAALGQK